jgi:P27 family predicted phage terminase small subunit
MRGRKPKPSHLRLVQGIAGHRPINKDEPVIAVALPSPPRHLSPAARKEWKRLGPLLCNAGLLSNLDRSALACYCQAVAHLAAAEDELALHGMTVTSETGVQKPSPYWYIAAKCTQQIVILGAEFGLSPSSRSRVHADTAKVEDAFEAYLEGKPDRTPG